MAEHSGFFNAKLVNGVYDRDYHAEDFARYFANFVGNGVFEDNLNDLMVSQSDVADMSVKVLSGQAFINGYRYENDDDFFLTIDVADGVLDRIDLIVLRLDAAERKIHLAIKKGTPTAKALAPSIQRDADIYELKLAEISIKAGVTNISQTDIADTRGNKNVCGFVRTVADKELHKLISEFEEVRKINEDMREDVTSLQMNLSIESEQYPGCFYRIADNGESEWVNPPQQPGIEYRITEKWGGKPLYQKTFYLAKLPASSSAALVVATGIRGDRIISAEIFAIDKDAGWFYPFPLMKSVGTAQCAIVNVRDTGEMIIWATSNLSDFEGYVTIKYTKG